MASITLFISWVSINKNLAIADKEYLLLCGLNSSVTRRLARKCSCNNCVVSSASLVAGFSTLQPGSLTHVMHIGAKMLSHNGVLGCKNGKRV